MEREFVVGAIGAATALLFTTCLGYPYLHNHYLHPVGRLSRQIEVGQPCDLVARKFAAHVKNEAGSSQAQYFAHDLTHDLLFTEEIPPSRGLSLYDVSVFDDLQIRVRCSAEGSVAEKLVILD